MTIHLDGDEAGVFNWQLIYYEGVIVQTELYLVFILINVEASQVEVHSQAIIDQVLSLWFQLAPINVYALHSVFHFKFQVVNNVVGYLAGHGLLEVDVKNMFDGTD